MTRENDTILFDEIRNGNERVFNQIFDNYYPCLCFYTNKYLNDFDLSRSVVQQVFVDLWIKRDRLQVVSLKSYLFQSARNASLDIIKHRKTEKRYLSTFQKIESFQDDDFLEEAELADKINKAIQLLPERCRVIFMMCRFEELKYADIAKRLNISVKTVEMQVSIALKRLRNELGYCDKKPPYRQIIKLSEKVISKDIDLSYRVS